MLESQVFRKDEKFIGMGNAASKLDGMVVLSGYPSALYDGLLTGWLWHEKATRTYGGRERVECVWLNPACARALKAREVQRVVPHRR